MARKYPIVLVDGTPRQLPPGDTVDGFNVGQALVGSGLVGGGDLATGDKRFDVALAATTSGLIFVGDSLGLTGEDKVTADTALASGNAALLVAEVAAASGVAAQSDANTALASGNAALYDAVNFESATSLQFVAGSDLTAGAPVGLDDGGRIQQIRYVRGDNGFETLSSVYGPEPFNYYTETIYIESKDTFFTGFTQRATNYGGAYASQISGNQCVNGTPVIYESNQMLYSAPVYHPPSDKVVLGHGGNSTANGVRLCTLSGLNVFVGGSGNSQIEAGYPTYLLKGVYNPSGQIVSFLWNSLIGGTYYQRARSVLGISGDVAYMSSISNIWSNAGLNNNAIVYDTVQDKYLMSFNAGSAPQSGVLMVGSFNGNTINTQQFIALSGGLTYFPTATYDESAARTIFVYRDSYAPLHYKAIPVEISGVTPILGTSSSFSPAGSGTTVVYNSAYDSSNQRVMIAFADSTSRPAAANVKTTGSVCTLTDPYYLTPPGDTYATPTIAWSTQADKALVVAISSATTGYSGISYVLSTSNEVRPLLNGVNNYIGSSRQTVSSGSTVNILLPKANDLEHSGLVPGAFYYIDPSASGYTTASGVPSGEFISWVGAEPWSYVAKAVSSSGLFLLDTL